MTTRPSFGDTLTAIAFEKAGIIKPGGITVSYPSQDPEALAELMRIAAERENTFVVGNRQSAEVLSSDLFGTRIRYGGLTLTVPLLGEHQVDNAITAIEALRVLRDHRGVRLPDEAIVAGIEAVSFPARFEILCRDPLIILDGAHNPSGLEMLGRSLSVLGDREVVAILGASQGKRVADALNLVLPHCREVICTAASYDRKALPVDGCSSSCCPWLQTVGPLPEEADGPQSVQERRCHPHISSLYPLGYAGNCARLASRRAK